MILLWYFKEINKAADVNNIEKRSSQRTPKFKFRGPYVLDPVYKCFRNREGIIHFHINYDILV